MGELVKQTLEDIMQIAAEQIALGNGSLSWISAWSEIAEQYGEI